MFCRIIINNVMKLIRETLVLSKNILNNFRGDYKDIDIRHNSVLIIEFASFHGENFPSLTKYLLNLGYNVDIIFRKLRGRSRNELGLFKCFEGDSRVCVRILPGMDMNLLLRSSTAALYKHVVIVTVDNKLRQGHLYKIDFFRLQPVCMMHNSNDADCNYFKTNKIIAPVRIDSINRKSPPYVVSIHYFGDYAKRKKSGKATFVALNTTDLSRRNMYLLFSACDELLGKGESNFSITVIGNGVSIPERFSDNFEVFGFLDFQKMSRKIAEADFILALIDQSSVQYMNKASGTYGLGYGFIKPVLLHRKFSIISGFNDENSVLYDENHDLANAMKSCINMSDGAYSDMASSLEISSRNLYDVSLHNLKEALEAPIQYVSFDKS